MTYFYINRFLLAMPLLLALTVKVGGTEAAGYSAIYNIIKNNNKLTMPSEEVFTIAYRGHTALRNESDAVKKDVLTVIDFSLSSSKKRLWIIDLTANKVLFNDYVAHGRNSGDNEAGFFSNSSGSLMSSIGFYITGETYIGKHGLSLFLDGMDKDYNTNARSRSIVMHGADYVSESFIKKYGRLGRSHGCPSVSTEIHQDVINTIKEGSTLFIYYPDPLFIKSSQVLNQEVLSSS